MRQGRRINYASWLLKLVTWDGVMPICLLLVPDIVERLFPNRRGPVEVMAVALPIAAFLVRFYIARRQINNNRCSRLFRRVQIGSLCVAIFVLFLIDSVMILARVMPKGALFATKLDLIVWPVLITIYLTCMAIAMYPGRAEQSAVN